MSAVVRVPEGIVRMVLGSWEDKLSPPPDVRAPGQWVTRACPASSSSWECPPGNNRTISSPLSWAVTLTLVHCLVSLLSLGAQITEGVKPTLSELEKFEDQPEGIDLEVVTESTGIWSRSVTPAREGVARGEQLPGYPRVCPCREGAGTQLPAWGQRGGV